MIIFSDSAGITTDAETVGPGKIRFLDSIQPPLEAGSYTLSARQEIKDIPNETVPPYIADQPILVDGPRFVLNPSQIHTLYPPANQQGSYENVLPNIVFNNFSLPWSRPIDPPPLDGSRKAAEAVDPDGNQIPWMGLLTLYPADMVVTDGSSKAGEPQTVTAAELVAPKDPKVLPPVLGNLFGAEDQKLSVVDMDLTFFQSIAPALPELPFLAHARMVNTDGKVILGMDDDGCFSLLTGNRLPQAGGRNTIYMVSYEGHQDHLRGSHISGGYTKIRLVLLGTWQFTANEARGSFIQLMANLCEPGRGGVQLMQMPYDDAIGAISPEAEEAIKIGYVPLQNKMRQGEQSTSWYRGPLMPAPTKRDFKYGPYHFSDHAIHYDPEYGIFNHAYSAAWQIGRLLALSDASFSTAFFNWRNQYLKKVVKDARMVTADKVRTIAGNTAEEATPETVVSALQHFFAGGFSKVPWPTIVTRTAALAAAGLPGMLTAEEKAAIIQDEEDPLLLLFKKIKPDQL